MGEYKQTNQLTTLYPTLQELSSQWIGVEGKPPQSEAQNRNTVGFLYGCAGFNISISHQIKLQNENKKKQLKKQTIKNNQTKETPTKMTKQTNKASQYFY